MTEDRLDPMEFSRRCRRLLHLRSDTVTFSEGVRRLVIIEDGWEIYINESNGGVSVGVCPADEHEEYARTAYADTTANALPSIWHGAVITDVCLPIFRKIMVLDDLASA